MGSFDWLFDYRIPEGLWIKNKGWFVSELAVDGLGQCAWCNRIHNTSSFIWSAALDSHYTLSDSALYHPASETLHLYDFITVSVPQQCLSCCEKYNYKSKLYIWYSTNLSKDPVS